METAPIPANEAQRLATLMCLRILDTPTEERFDRITRLVAAHFHVATAAINLIDADRLWAKAQIGLGTTMLPRAISFCAHTVVLDDVLIVADTTVDERFCDNPLVTGPSAIRFYAGVPLRSPDGYTLGALCIADAMPRTLTPTEIKHLQDFATWAERELTTQDLSVALLHQQETEDALRTSEARYATVLASLSEGIVHQDAQGYIYTCNASAERILGLSAEQMMGRSSIDPRWHTIHEDGSDFPGAIHPSVVALHTGQPQENVVMGVYKPDGVLTWISVNAHPLYYPRATTPYGTVSSFIDITANKEYERQVKAYQCELEAHNATLTVLATTDGLTNIANKRTLLETLERAVSASQQTRLPLALVLLDVDHFKSYNDTFGHPAGDVVLQQVASLLSSHVRSSDVVARYGGEEFVVILPNTDSQRARSLAERFRALIAHASFPHRSITASFGVASLQSQFLTAGELIEHADIALYEAKRQGRNAVVCAPTEFTSPLAHPLAFNSA